MPVVDVHGHAASLPPRRTQTSRRPIASLCTVGDQIARVCGVVVTMYQPFEGETVDLPVEVLPLPNPKP